MSSHIWKFAVFMIYARPPAEADKLFMQAKQLKSNTEISWQFSKSVEFSKSPIYDRAQASFHLQPSRLNILSGGRSHSSTSCQESPSPMALTFFLPYQRERHSLGKAGAHMSVAAGGWQGGPLGKAGSQSPLVIARIVHAKQSQHSRWQAKVWIWHSASGWWVMWHREDGTKIKGCPVLAAQPPLFPCQHFRQ